MLIIFVKILQGWESGKKRNINFKRFLPTEWSEEIVENISEV